MARVLVGYGTKMGGTTDIAEKIGYVIENAGHEVDVVEAGNARDLESYDAAVIGSGLYAGMWRGPAKRLVRKLAKTAPTTPLWLFHSGPIGEDEADESQRFPGWLRDLESTLDVRDKATFGGLLEEDAPGMIAKSLIKKGLAGDFRDMEKVGAWAEGIAAAL